MNKKYKILMIDDDIDLSMIIVDMLESYGFQVHSAVNGKEACEILEKNQFDIILMDINLPDSTGFELCEEIRKYSTVPIIFASARTDEIDRIKSYDIGGDDYLQKPYSIKELLSHINAIIRRTYGFSQKDKIITFGNISINTTSRSVYKNQHPVNLSLREFDLLVYLCKNKNKAIPKNQLLSEVWGTFSSVEPSTLTVHIRWLREKLEDDPANPQYIKTIYRVGYKLEVNHET